MAAIVARGKLVWRGHMDDVDVPVTIDALLAGGDVVVVRSTVAWRVLPATQQGCPVSALQYLTLSPLPTPFCPIPLM